MTQGQFDFVRSHRDRRINALPAGSRLKRLMLAVDRIGCELIAAHSERAFIDDGPTIVAEITNAELSRAMHCSANTVVRAIHDAHDSPWLDVLNQIGRPNLFCLRWLKIPALAVVADGRPPQSGREGIAQRPPADSLLGGVSGAETPPSDFWGGSHAPNRGKSGGSQGASQIPCVCESSDLPSVDLCAVEPCSVQGVQGEPDGGGGLAAGFFAPEISGQLPWQRLIDAHLIGLDPSMLAVLYVEALKSRNVPADGHDARWRFLACAWHCARDPKLETYRARTFVSRIRKRNYRYLRDEGWNWGKAQLGLSAAGFPHGAGAAIDAALRRAIRIERERQGVR